MRNKIIAGNWKMNLNYEEAKKLLQDIGTSKDKFNQNCEIVVIPPTPYLSVFHELLKNNDWIKLGAQNVYPEKEGPFTGETSPSQLNSLGVSFCLVGHSERRDIFEEDNAFLIKKTKALLQEDITPIFCCGEHLQVRDSNVHKEFIMRQIEETVFTLSVDEISKIVIAYEPVWAIGTGKNATSEQAQEIHQLIRSRIAKDFGDKVANQIPILYGGSMNPDNAAELLQQNDIDGGLIGGASLKMESFSEISKGLK